MGRTLLTLSSCGNLPTKLDPGDLEVLRSARQISIMRDSVVKTHFHSAEDTIEEGLIASGKAVSIAADQHSPAGILDELDLPAPGALLAATLRRELRDRGRFGNASEGDHIVSSASGTASSGARTNADYEFEIAPAELSVLEHVVRKPRYELLFVGRVKLVRLSDGKTVWSDYCTYYARDDKRLLFDEDPFANRAVVLGRLLPIAAEGCAKKLSRSVLAG